MKRNPVIFTCFIICLSAFFFSLPNLLAQAPPGYTYCAGENGTFTLPAKSHLAYGANGKFKYLFNQTGTVTFSNDFFGGDPIFGVPKSGYYKISDGTESSVTLVNAMQSIRNHITGANILTATQLNSISATIQQNIFLIAKDSLVVQEAFAVADTYETIKGPIFLNSATTGSFPNDFGALDGFELVRAVFLVQQGIMDYVYLPEEVEKYKGMIAGRYFKTANYFPGSCPNPVDPAATYTAIINASMPAEYGKRTAFSSTPARRPTGYYLAPGNLGRVRVPEHMVNKGFKILVGAHTFERTGSNPTRRFFRVTNTFPINDTITEIINPFGGGIYIITPYLADEGIVEIQLTNVVPAPFFSAKNSDQTTLQEWLDVQRHNPAPWADFESDKYMMQVPTSWIYNYSDPVTLMTDWDQRLDVVSRLLGYPAVRNNTILYLQIDVDIMFGGYGIGNPQINNTYNPYTVENGNKNHWMLKPGAGFWETEFHEMGHAQLFSNFPGEGEASVNLLSAAIYNQLYGIDIDVALGKSFDNQAHRTRDQAALNWMVTPNFRAGNPMDISNTTKDEVRYQHRGYAKYVEIAALFGWEVLDSFYNREQLDFIAQTPSDGLTGVDSRILRMSRAAGTDLRPLIHFWGVQPKNPAVLESRILSENLQPSKLICDRLTHYKSIIPADNAQFLAHAYAFFAGPIPSGGNPDYGSGWYNVWKSQYNSSHGAAANAAMQNIIDLYFPEGCPLAPAPPEVTVNSAAICPGESVTLTASGAAFYQWSTGATGNSITVSPSQTTTLTVIGKSAGVLSFPATATVTVNPLPVLSVTDAVVCAGSPATLTVTGANDYMWSDGSTGSSVTIAGEQSVTLTVTGISEGCESAPVEATVTVNPLPVLSVTDAVVCAGSPATLTVTGANDYMWSDGSTGSSVTIAGEQSVTLTVTGISEGCESAPVEATVTVNPLPVLSVTDAVVCAGSPATLTVTGANDYMWSDGSTGSSVTVAGEQSVTLTVTGISEGCESAPVEATVTVNPLPVLSVTDAVVCTGSPATLTVTGANDYMWSDGSTGSSVTIAGEQSVTLTVTGISEGCESAPVEATVTVNPLPVLSVTDAVVCAGSPATLTVTGANDYMWSDGSTGSSVTFAGEQSVTLTVTGISEGCESAPVEATVTVNPLPVLSVTDAVVCAGSPATLTVTGANDYLWSDGSTGSSVTIAGEQSVTLTVTGISEGCESAPVEATVTVNPLPVLSVTDAVVCAGSPATLTVTGANDYLWSDGSTGSSVTVMAEQTTEYTITGTSMGCSSTISSVVVVHPLPIVQLGADIVLQAGQQITLDAAGQNQTYQWSNGATTAAIVVQAMGTYTVTVTSTSGCTATDEIEVSIISSVGYPEERMNISVMPNPTLDRVNVICTGSMTNYVRVIDEWGRIVFEDNQLVADGEARQIDFSALPAATYRILVSGPDIKETLMVIRQ